MNEDYVMRPGDRFVAQECGCAMTVISGPNEAMMAIQAPRCCCGHEMIKSEAFFGGTDVFDIPEPAGSYPVLAGMVE
jgi:hypothetical protein